MIKAFFISTLVLMLTGCASNCTHACLFGFGPGNSAFDKIADYHDNTDPCQFKGKPEGYKLPSFCGASSKPQNVYSPNGKLLYVVK